MSRPAPRPARPTRSSSASWASCKSGPGADDAPGSTGGIGDLHAFFLLTERPEVYGLPGAPTLPSTRVRPGLLAGLATMAGFALAAALAFAGRD